MRWAYRRGLSAKRRLRFALRSNGFNGFMECKAERRRRFELNLMALNQSRVLTYPFLNVIRVVIDFYVINHR